MTITFGLMAALVLGAVLMAAGAALLVAAPWAGGRAPLRDHLRIGRAVVVFDAFLESAGVSGRRRRDLRDELRGNLYEAAARDGADAAVTALGPLRELAHGYAGDPAGRQWARGMTWAVASVVVLAALSLVTMFTWLDAATASDAARVAGRPVASPWLHYDYRRQDAGFTVDTGISTWVLLVPVAGTLLGARVWRRGARASARR